MLLYIVKYIKNLLYKIVSYMVHIVTMHRALDIFLHIIKLFWFTTYKNYTIQKCIYQIQWFIIGFKLKIIVIHYIQEQKGKWTNFFPIYLTRRSTSIDLFLSFWPQLIWLISFMSIIVVKILSIHFLSEFYIIQSVFILFIHLRWCQKMFNEKLSLASFIFINIQMS